MAKLAIVIPILNEGDVIADNLTTVLSQAGKADHEWELIAVDDGSDDDSAGIISQLARSDPRIKLLSLTRHYGKEAAIQAGLLYSRHHDAVIVMDSDLQHPPELIPGMVGAWLKGALVVNGVKNFRGPEAITRGWLSRLYFILFRKFTPLDIDGDTDFKLLDRQVVRAYTQLPESGRFFRGLISWMNFPATSIEFDVPDTGTERRSSWSSYTLLKYALSSITAFSALPLQIVTLLGVFSLIISVIFGSIALYDKLTGNAVDGFTTVILLILLLSSILMISVGLIGTYIGKIYDEVKRRPLFFVDYNKSTIDRDD